MVTTQELVPTRSNLPGRILSASDNVLFNSGSTLALSGSGAGYDGATQGRRMSGWNPTRLGPTTTLWNTLPMMISRSRDSVRNNPWAASALDNFESQLISTGGRPRWKYVAPAVKKQLELKFNRWARKVDAGGRLSFYGMQALAAREMFEAGEVLTRLHTRPTSWKLSVPLQLQLLESEQMPLFLSGISGNSVGNYQVPEGNTVRTGIEFDKDGRRVAYFLYKEHPGETALYQADAITYMRVPAENMLHTYRQSRAGQLRGTPHLSAVLTLLWEIEQYNDAEIARKKIQTMWAAFIKKTSPEGEILVKQNTVPGTNSPLPTPGWAASTIESGTITELLPGEDVIFSQIPQDSDFTAFMKFEARRFAAAIGATYEQITGDLEGVSYSSIRAGLLDFRRKCEQLQINTFVHQFCQPIVERWMDEGYISGALDLPDYVAKREDYQDVEWTFPGWDWVDPVKDVAAAIAEVRGGLSTRSHHIASRGWDAADLDAEWKQDADREDALGLVYDTNPAKVIQKGTQGALKPDGTEMPDAPPPPKGPKPPTKKAKRVG